MSGSNPIVLHHHTNQLQRNYQSLGQSGHKWDDRSTYKLLKLSYNIIPDMLTDLQLWVEMTITLTLRNISELHQ